MTDRDDAQYSCFYPFKSRLSREDADRISQASVYLADSVYIPATAALDPAGSADDRNYVHTRLSELKEIRAVRLWQAEGFAEVGPGETRAVSGEIDITVDHDSYRDLHGQVMSRLVANRDHFRGSESFDGVAEVVEGKHALFLFALKDKLGASAILLDDRATANISRYFSGLTEQLALAEEVVHRLAVRLHLPDVGELGIDQVDSIRRHMPQFRTKLIDAIGDEQLLFYEREEMVERLTNVIIDDFFEYVDSMRATASKRRSMVRSWNFLQLILSPVLSRSDADRFFGWSGKEALAPEMILLELHRMRDNTARTLADAKKLARDKPGGKMNDILRVYLCGSIKKGNEDKRSGFWTDEDIKDLEGAVTPNKLTVLNPGDRRDDLSDVRATFGRDLLQVFTSHAILVDAREKRGVGVGAEMLFAKSNHIPVIAVAPRDSHYHRTDVTLMGQFVADWVHPFISELSDAVVESVHDAGRLAASLSTLPSRGGQAHFTDAMLHYVTTQASREPEMVALLTEAKGLPERASEFLSNASFAPTR